MTLQAKYEFEPGMNDGYRTAVGVWFQGDQEWLPTPQGQSSPQIF